MAVPQSLRSGKGQEKAAKKLLVAPGLTTRSKKLLVTKGIATRSKKLRVTSAAWIVWKPPPLAAATGCFGTRIVRKLYLLLLKHAPPYSLPNPVVDARFP